MNHRQVLPCALLLSMLLFEGSCTTAGPVQVSYDAASDQSSYASNRVLLGAVGMAQGLASGQRIMWQALASCVGRGCTPLDVELVFYNDSDYELNVDSRRLQLTYDGMSHDWEDLSRLDEPAHYAVRPGEFFRASLAGGDFVRMAKAEQVQVLLGQSGTQAVDIPFARRAAFRAFAKQVGLDE